MFLTQIKLDSFKNYEQLEISFNGRVICLTGNNGMGKTNLLDAIHYLSIGKSYFNNIDSQNVNYNADYFTIEGHFKNGPTEDANEFNIFCGFAPGRKKVIKKNDVVYERIADHIGQVPVIMLSPSDIKLIIDGSEERRKFLDTILSQIKRPYLELLLKYFKTLEQRNSILKQHGDSGKRINISLLEVYDNMLHSTGTQIFEFRKKFLQKFEPVFLDAFKEIAGVQENIAFTYQSQLHDQQLSTLLKEGSKLDMATQRTNYGIHKDDVLFTIDDKPLKKFGSQGQQKTFLTALKLTHREIIMKSTGQTPLFLLDDIFDKLDDGRVHRFVELISKPGFGQIFITDTSEDRIKNTVLPATGSIELININSAKIVKQETISSDNFYLKKNQKC